MKISKTVTHWTPISSPGRSIGNTIILKDGLRYCMDTLKKNDHFYFVCTFTFTLYTNDMENTAKKRRNILKMKYKSYPVGTKILTGADNRKHNYF